MKRQAFFVFTTTLWVLAAAVGAFAIAGASAMEELIINVVEGRFLCGEVAFELADAIKPIAVGYIHGNAIVQIETEYGIEEIDFGQAQIALTQNAVPYVKELDYDLGDIPETYETCPTCGRSTKIGNHTALPCGHWGCLKPVGHLRVCAHCKKYLCNGKDHTLCEHCGVHRCVHVDIECPYVRNPAPTAYVTMGPEDKPVYFRIADDGSEYQGRPGVKELGWAPQDAYMKTRPTAPPELRNEEEGMEGEGMPGSGGGAQGGGGPQPGRP